MSGPSLVFVLPSLQPGGAERVVIQLANGAARHVATTLVVIDGRGPFRDLVDDQVELIDLRQQRVRSGTLPLLRFLRTRRPDAVIASHTHVNILLGMLRPLIPRATRTVARQADLRGSIGPGDRRVRLAQRTVYRGLDLVLATSPWMATDVARRHRGPIAILPNPVDVASLRATVPAAAPRTDADEGRHFVHVARLFAAKGVHDVVDAFAAGSRPADRLTLVGDGPEQQSLHDRVARLGLGERVRLTGFDPDPVRHVIGADALLLASYSEGMPNVVLEALAVGTPVIATDELVTLQGLASTLPAGVLRLVPRPDLAHAIAETPRRSGTLLPSLLPDEHHLDPVIDRLLMLVVEAGG